MYCVGPVLLFKPPQSCRCSGGALDNPTSHTIRIWQAEALTLCTRGKARRIRSESTTGKSVHHEPFVNRAFNTCSYQFFP